MTIMFVLDDPTYVLSKELFYFLAFMHKMPVIFYLNGRINYYHQHCIRPPLPPKKHVM